jgi:threonine dehydratase
MINHERISVATIEAARMRIRPEFLDSRLAENSGLSRSVGARVLCKLETENPVGCFKGRGADSFVNSLPPGTKELMAASAGNFGLALANAAARRGIAVTIYAAAAASAVKLDRIRRTGARVIQQGNDFDEAKHRARTAAEEKQVLFVEDGRKPAITAGAGTIGMELTAASKNIRTLVVPLGNGALLAGLGCWFRARSPKTRIVGVCAEGAPAMALSWCSHSLRSTPAVTTIADGIAVRVPVADALGDLQTVVDDIVLVSDDSMKHGLKLLYEHLGLLVEPAGAAGIAALLAHSSLASQMVCVAVTGGNVNPGQVQKWIDEIS